jgi:hypothetical protein
VNKIPTFFLRDEKDRKHVTFFVTPGCEWVLAGEGTATRKYDGTCMMNDGSSWYSRRQMKDLPDPPTDDFWPVEHDEVTGKWVGWEPVGLSSFKKFWQEAVKLDMKPGTYELCGPKVNGNPEGFEHHVLIAHDDAEVLHSEAVDDLINTCAAHHWEGVVWKHPDGRMAKLKVKDFA